MSPVNSDEMDFERMLSSEYDERRAEKGIGVPASGKEMVQAGAESHIGQDELFGNGLRQKSELHRRVSRKTLEFHRMSS
jgi:hypothetical protein